MAVVTLVQPTESLIEHFGNNLRPIDRLEAALFSGQVPMDAIRESVVSSFDSKVALVDDEPVCIFGIAAGTDVCFPWLLGTHLMDEQPPVRIMVQAREFLSKYTSLYLRNAILSDNIRSIRFLSGLGFSFTPAFDYEGYSIKLFERRPICV